MPPAASSPTPLPALPPMVTGPTIVDAKTPRLTTLTAVNQDVAIVVRELALKFGLQYRIDPAVRGVVNVDLRNRTLPEALAAILPRGTSFEIRDGVLLVAPARVATRTFSLDYVALSRFGTTSTVIQRRLPPAGAAAPASASAPPNDVSTPPTLRSAAVNLGVSDVVGSVSVADVWEEIRVGVEALVFDQTDVAGRRVIVNPMAGTITVSALPDRLEQVEAFIRSFESSIQRQAVIDATIVEVELDPAFLNGIDWSAVASRSAGASVSQRPSLASGVELTLPGGSAQIAAVIAALSTQGGVRVLSKPRASALNNQRVVFDVTTGEIVFNRSRAFVTSANGDVTPVTQVNPTQVNVGVVLDVLPQIAADNTITMHVRPAVTSVVRTARFEDADGTKLQVPVIDRRESDTMARLGTGETMMIGGLMHTRHERVRRGVPLLRDIPLLGLLFGSNAEVDRKSELVVFLTPTIIAGQPIAAR
jgi:MSHA biogenesis protein MshL